MECSYSIKFVVALEAEAEPTSPAENKHAHVLDTSDEEDEEVRTLVPHHFTREEGQEHAAGARLLALIVLQDHVAL